MTADDDARFMRAALALGRRGMGRTAPNPSVAALVVRDGVVVGRGITAPGGRPHAEPIALAQAGSASRGAMLYVTLEPCSHHGRTPPCVQAVLAAGVTRVVVALRDPDPRVAGRGIAQLRAARLEVLEGVAAAEALQDHIGHVQRVTLGRPSVTVKMAETVDGIAAAAPDTPRLLITGARANAYVHRLRSLHDAVLIGRGTAEADDPQLTVRLPGVAAANPTRIVLDTGATLSLESQLVRTARTHPVIVVVGSDVGVNRTARLEAQGVEICRMPVPGLNLGDVLQELGTRGLTRILCEGGPALASEMILRGFADTIVRLTSPNPNGAMGGKPAFAREASRLLSETTSYALEDDARLGADRLRTYSKVRS